MSILCCFCVIFFVLFSHFKDSQLYYFPTVFVCECVGGVCIGFCGVLIILCVSVEGKREGEKKRRGEDAEKKTCLHFLHQLKKVSLLPSSPCSTEEPFRAFWPPASVVWCGNQDFTTNTEHNRKHHLHFSLLHSNYPWITMYLQETLKKSNNLWKTSGYI